MHTDRQTGRQRSTDTQKSHRHQALWYLPKASASEGEGGAASSAASLGLQASEGECESQLVGEATQQTGRQTIRAAHHHITCHIRLTWYM